MNWSGYYPPILLSILNNLYLVMISKSRQHSYRKAKCTIDNNDRKMNFLLIGFGILVKPKKKICLNNHIFRSSPKDQFLPLKLKHLESIGLIFYRKQDTFNKLFEYYLQSNNSTIYTSEALFRDEDNYRFISRMF